jgi:hypothetical protein
MCRAGARVTVVACAFIAPPSRTRQARPAARRTTPTWRRWRCEKRHSFLEFFLCLSRACLGKTIVFILYELLKNGVFRRGALSSFDRGAKNGIFLRHLYIKTNILPRQARDKHRENSKKSGCVFRRTVLHEVRPSYAKRTALSLWMLRTADSPPMVE